MNYEITYAGIQRSINDINASSQKIDSLRRRLESVRNGITSPHFFAIRSNVTSRCTSVGNAATATKGFNTALVSLRDEYLSADNRVNGVLAGFSASTATSNTSLDSTSSNSENKAWWEQLWDGAKDIALGIGNAIQWVGESYSVIKPYTDIVLGVTAVTVGILGLVGTVGLSTPVSALAITAGLDRIFAGSSAILGVKEGKGMTAFEGLGEFIGHFSGETGAKIGESAGTLVSGVVGTAAAFLIGDVAVVVKNVTDLLEAAKKFSEGDIFESIFDTVFVFLKNPANAIATEIKHEIVNFILNVFSKPVPVY